MSIQLSFRAYPPKKITDGFAICATHFACCRVCVLRSSSIEEGKDVPTPNPSGQTSHAATLAQRNPSTNMGRGPGSVVEQLCCKEKAQSLESPAERTVGHVEEPGELLLVGEDFDGPMV